jgi:hypothetical protein
VFTVNQRIRNVTTPEIITDPSVKALASTAQCILHVVPDVYTLTASNFRAYSTPTASRSEKSRFLLVSNSDAYVTYDVSFSYPVGDNVTALYNALVSQLDRDISNNHFTMIMEYYSQEYHGNLSTAFVIDLPKTSLYYRSASKSNSGSSNSSSTSITVPIAVSLSLCFAILLSILFVRWYRKKYMYRDENTADKIEQWIESKTGDIETTDAYHKRQQQEENSNSRMSGSFFGLGALLGRMTGVVKPTDRIESSRLNTADVVYGNNNNRFQDNVDVGTKKTLEMAPVGEYLNNPMSSSSLAHQSTRSIKLSKQDQEGGDEREGGSSYYTNNPAWSMRLTRGSKAIDEVPSSPRVHSGEYFSNYMAYTGGEGGDQGNSMDLEETSGDGSTRQPSLRLTGVNPNSRISTSFKGNHLSLKSDTM